MKKANSSTSACRFCRFYEPEGRRGGSCQMLGVPVQSSWEACDFALPPFVNTLKKLENIFQLPTLTTLEATEKAVTKIIDANFEDDCPRMAIPKTE